MLMTTSQAAATPQDGEHFNTDVSIIQDWFCCIEQCLIAKIEYGNDIKMTLFH